MRLYLRQVLKQKNTSCIRTQSIIITDTDSLMYEIKTGDVYKGFSKDNKMFWF